MVPRAIFKIYQDNLKGLVESRGYDIEWSLVQALIALSEKPLGKFIATWAEEGGGLSAFKRVAKRLDIGFARVFKGYGPDEATPWSFIRIPYEKHVSTHIQSEIIHSFIEKASRLSSE